MQRPYRVLIAHQSTIPHYRVRFYELLEQMRPRHWTFEVAYDTRETRRPRLYLEPVDHRAFGFPVLDAPVTLIRLGGRRVVWQHCILKGRRYDVIVTDTHMTDIAYPLLTLYRMAGKRHIFWGHLRDMNVEQTGAVKELGQRLKLWFIKHSDFFFAYTEGMKQQAIAAGVEDGRIHVMNNTIDTVSERKAYLELLPDRAALRARLGVEGRKVLLYVGRLIHGKRIGFLLEAFTALFRRDPAYHLFIAGGGDEERLVRDCQRELGNRAITILGPISAREELAPVCTASDLYVLPGSVGLAPLQAICYNLPVVAFGLATHGPEFEYLGPDNSVILPGHTSPQQFADAVPGILDTFSPPSRREQLYGSIAHLTLESMVERFIAGVNAACATFRK